MGGIAAVLRQVCLLQVVDVAADAGHLLFAAAEVGRQAPIIILNLLIGGGYVLYQTEADPRHPMWGLSSSCSSCSSCSSDIHAPVPMSTPRTGAGSRGGSQI